MYEESRQHLELSLPWDCTDPAMGRRLAAYEWGLLSPEEDHQFEQHLLQCPACAAELESSWAAGVGIRASRRDRSRYAWVSVGLAAAAAVLFIILEFGGVMNPHGRPAGLSETQKAAPEQVSWTFELDIPSSDSFSYNLDIPGPS